MLEKFIGGDLEAFDQLYNEKFPHLFRLVLWKTSLQLDFLEAEGVVQQAFFKIFNKAATYNGQTDGKAWAWISTITHRQMIDVIRQKEAHEKRLVNLDEETCASLATLIDELALDNRGWLEKFFASLSEREQQVFMLLSDGIAQKDIAAQLLVSLPRITQIVKSIQKKGLKFER